MKSLIIRFLITVYFMDSVINGLNCPRHSYSTCNPGKPGHINVHLVSHSHNDLGWTKTVQEYYNGSSSNYRPNYRSHPPITVKSILDSVVKELQANPSRRFIYTEIGFFWMWWNEQNEETKRIVRSLVDQGRFEFIMGSWSMNDEATTYYSDIIDQQTLGFRFIMEEFGACAIPKVAWQIDTFGHSREQASLFARFGFDGMFLGRVDFQDGEIRSRTKEREMVWHASENRNDSSAQIFTTILPNVYWPPHGFCFDVVPFCNHHDIGSETTRDELGSRIDSFLKIAHDQARIYKTNHLIMTFGNDFTHSKAQRWFDNLDNLIFHVNERQRTHQRHNSLKVNIFHSTPACYLYALNQQREVKWNVKYDDFFPYADKAHAYWTGFFTSRPTFKHIVRQASSFLKPVRQLAAVANMRDRSSTEAIATLEMALAVAQHHDAVTGTQKQYVADDYLRQLRIGVEKCSKLVTDAINVLIRRIYLGHHAQTNICLVLADMNAECSTSRNNFNVLVYNPLGRGIRTWISLPVYGSNYQVIDLLSEQIVSSDVAPVYEEARRVPDRKFSHDSGRLIFEVDLPPMGFRTYSVRRSSQIPPQILPLSSFEREFVVRNSFIGLKFDSEGNLVEVQNLRHAIQSELRQTMCYYVSMSGSNVRPEDSSSGAYIFRPRGSAYCLRVRHYSVAHLNQLTEIHQVFNDWISQTIRLYHDSQHVEFDWQIGPIDISDSTGKEVIIRFDSDLKSHGVFYTDSNGREIITRRRNYRTVSEPVAGNYYPVNAQLFIRDEETLSMRRQLTLVNDRSQGGSSIHDGSLELMLHRRLLRDDGRGVEEALNELGSDRKGLVANGVISLIFDTVEESASLYRELAHQINSKPLVGLSNDYNTRYLAGLSGLNSQLPVNLHLLTFALEKQSNNEGYKSVLVRIEHFYERNEDRRLSVTVQLDLREVFKWIGRIRKIEELALGSNIRVEELDNRLKWKTDFFGEERFRYGKSLSNEFIYTFDPMEIKTFRIFFENNF